MRHGHSQILNNPASFTEDDFVASGDPLTLHSCVVKQDTHWRRSVGIGDVLIRILLEIASPVVEVEFVILKGLTSEVDVETC